MTEIEELRAEIAALRREIAALRAGQTVHHYHHGPSLLEPQLPRFVQPQQPSPYFGMCGGQAVGIGYSVANEARQ